MSYSGQGIGSSVFGNPPRSAFDGFGAITFSGSTVWADWLAGASGDNAAGKRAAQSVRAALAQLGYGSDPSMNSAWGSSADKSAYTQFASDNGISPPSGMPTWWPSKEGMLKLDELVKAGVVVGPEPVTEYHNVGGTLVKGPAPGQHPIGYKASMTTGTKVALAVVAAAVIGGAVLMSKKKKGGSTSLAKATPNGWRRRASKRGRRRWGRR